MLPSLDFETYSESGYLIDPATLKVRGAGPQGKGGLPVVGLAAYAEHPSTEILSLDYNLLDGGGCRLWVPGAPSPLDLFEHIAAGRPLEAHNAAFEWWIWNMVAVRKLSWPPLPIDILHCSMVRARRNSLPAGLDALAKVLGTPGKEPDGKRLLQKLSRPHTPTKKRPGIRHTLATAWEDYVRLYGYNEQDVAAEMAASEQIPPLTDWEYQTYRVDRTINTRGVQVDTETLDAALDLLDRFEQRQTQRLVEVTGGAVQSASEVAKIIAFLRGTGCWAAADLQADTVTEVLQLTDLTPTQRQILEIRQQLSAASVKKLRTLKLQLSSDGRLREQYNVFGADRTGRWSAWGVQLQNLTNSGPDVNECEGCGKLWGRAAGAWCPRCNCADLVHERDSWDDEAIGQAIEDTRTGNLGHVERVWGDVTGTLAGCLRGLFVAAPGKKLVCVDFSAIEAVVAACLSRCQWRIEVFQTHGKIYEASAAKAIGVPVEEILDHKKRTGHHHPARSGVGKVRELAYGYGGWIGAAKQFGADDHYESDEAIKADILKWRDESPEIVHMWGGQFLWCGPGKWDYRPELHGLEGMAIAAILNPGSHHTYVDITYHVENDCLHCRLPSGRYLHYHRPRLTEAIDKLNRGPCWSISFEGWNSNPKKGPRGWIRMETYAGRLFENCVQAVAFDIQADALARCEAADYPIVMHSHDEGLAEVPDDSRYSVQAMVDLFEIRSQWAGWYPIRAAGWEGYRYRK